MGTVNNNLHAIRCVGNALRRLGIEVADDELLAESANHNIGYLAGARGLSVKHRYGCTFDDVKESINTDCVVIAAIGDNALQYVIIDAIIDESITVTDSANHQFTRPLNQFEDAWSSSSYYLILISNNTQYLPHPTDLSGVEMDAELRELQEAIAENAHEVWAEARQAEGWTYGPVRDDSSKQHPDMMPYNLLQESEKEYDRLMAINTIKLIKKLGWTFSRKKEERRHFGWQNMNADGFSDTECRAIVSLILRMISVDHQISPKELSKRREIFRELGIPFEHERYPLAYAQACCVMQSMDGNKRKKVLDALMTIANADGKFDIREQQMLNEILAD